VKPEKIKEYLDRGSLRKASPDKATARSIISSAQTNAQVALGIELSENSATLVFRELYESIKELGDARWRILGYSPEKHEPSMEILKEYDVKDKVKLNALDRIRAIRHDANYRGFRVSVSQAKEIIDFWNGPGKEILKKLAKQAGA